MHELVHALETTPHLRIQDNGWQLGDAYFEHELVEKTWPTIVPRLNAAVQRVTFHDDGEYESAPFLAAFPKLEQLVLYGTTLLSELDALREHPELRRVALTNYTSLDASAGGLDWLNTLPALEEVIFLDGFVELGDWTFAPPKPAQLRSLWLDWWHLKRLDVASFTGLELVTLHLENQLIESISELPQEPAELAEFVEYSGLSVDDLRQRFSLIRPETRLRLWIDGRETAEKAARLDRFLSLLIPAQAARTILWDGANMPELNERGFLAHPVSPTWPRPT